MNLEDISVVMKLCDDNVLKLHENLRSYQRDVRRVKKLMTKRWANVERLDRGIMALHDQLVGSLSEVNAYIIKLNLHIELNRPLDRFTEEERSEDSLDELCSPNNASSRAIKVDAQLPQVVGRHQIAAVLIDHRVTQCRKIALVKNINHYLWNIYKSQSI